MKLHVLAPGSGHARLEVRPERRLLGGRPLEVGMLRPSELVRAERLLTCPRG